MDFLNLDPGNPADALISNGETVSIFTKDFSWGIVGSKDWEIAVIGFSNNDSIEVFKKAFSSNIGNGKYFDTLDSYISEFKEMFNWDQIPREWLDFKENYSKRPFVLPLGT